ncbi:MAG: hypothetical protein LBQ24_00515 [Candidatus Peribacteria bacterium]|nr:hypothetical protein [Candidatus Peribacteria bacterium]
MCFKNSIQSHFHLLAQGISQGTSSIVTDFHLWSKTQRFGIIVVNG